MRSRAALVMALCLSACDSGASPLANAQGNEEPGPFPAADRPVAEIISSRWSTEEARDRLNEADEVMDRAGIKPGMTVADIGAGEGYYTVRLAERVGKDGRVLAEDIVRRNTRYARDPRRSRAAGQCQRAARRARKSDAARKQLRPHLHGPYVS